MDFTERTDGRRLASAREPSARTMKASTTMQCGRSLRRLSAPAALIVTLLAVNSARAAPPALADLDGYVQGAMMQWRVPGIKHQGIHRRRPRDPRGRGQASVG